MNSYVICAGTDGDPDDVVMFGPFGDDTWAAAWLKQHTNDPTEGIPDGAGFEPALDQRMEDFDHFCSNMATSDGIHTIVHTVVEASLDIPEKVHS